MLNFPIGNSTISMRQRVLTKRLASNGYPGVHTASAAELATKFVELDCDTETQAFMDKCIQRPRFLRWAMGVRANNGPCEVVARILRTVFSRTTANGILGKGGMFVMSKAHARTLLQRDEESGKGGVLLDVGAGDGNVTVCIYDNT
eukprot:1184326-Prorocentrum_minimum.AAC.4